MARCSGALRNMGRDESSMAEVAQEIVGFFRESLVDQEGEPVCALARLFKLHPYQTLPPELQERVRNDLGEDQPRSDLPCLVLLGTRGLEDDWNHPERSVSHRVIPLPDPESLGQVPMFANLLDQLAFRVDRTQGAGPESLVGALDAPYNVFHFPEALGCSAIPAQEDFVLPYGIRSTLGYGSYLPSGSMYLVALFCQVPVPAEVAPLFRPLALSTRLALGRFDGGRVFPQ